MRGGGFAIGRILGVRIRVHPSWFVIFALVVISLATLGGPGDGRRLAEPFRWVLAVGVASLFFASVLVHELAHAVVARRRGVQVNEITLFIFGGAANLEQEAPTPRTEALVSAAGPIASVVVGLVFLAIRFATRTSTDVPIEVISAVCYWLGVSNLLLAGFNLIPGFPMDGGRLLRALVWSVTKDFVRATRVATLVGRAFAYLLIAAGVIVALSGEGVGGVVNGIWLAFIGWFLNQAAETSYRRVEFERLVTGVRVGDVMDRDVAVVSPNLTIDTLVDQHLLTGKASFYPVAMDGTLVGTIEISQVSKVPRGSWPLTRVTDVMSRGERLVTLTEPQSVMDAVQRFETTGVSGIAVVAEDDPRQLIGLVSRDGLFRALRNRAQLRA